MMAKMYEIMNTSQQQTQVNAKAIANMERRIAQMAEDQRRRDNRKLPSNTEVNPNRTQRAGKEHVNSVETEWRSVTMEDLVGKESENKDEKDVQKEEQSTVAGDTRILKEICERNEQIKMPTPVTVRLTVKASEALLGTLPKKEKEPGSPLITVTVDSKHNAATGRPIHKGLTGEVDKCDCQGWRIFLPRGFLGNGVRKSGGCTGTDFGMSIFGDS
ncbi:hypothetical protein L2E82_44727 [Cichorium intybus]|uniref:Uncharacterized protein n=1 Tax=Cichorium intybus TaxID=13427 RepID=A0ACB8ZRX9_CICIN|nr:hypothetical protein L2E82_44727 [Cichorium intybus]